MAIQQADKLLKKHKDLHCAKVSSFALELLIFKWVIYCNFYFKGKRYLINLFSYYVCFLRVVF